MEKEREERLPLGVGSVRFAQITEGEELPDIANSVAGYPVEEAVAIIDNFDRLTAAFVVWVFRMVSDWPADFAGIPTLRFTARYAKDLCEKADELNIRGSKGFLYARAQIYNETGIPVLI